LSRTPNFALVKKWQDAARLAVAGEREIASIQWAHVEPGQTRVMVKDTADLVRGLVTLDIRYSVVPGWRFLEQKGRLMTAATAASGMVAAGDLNVSIDGFGWRPGLGAIEGSALPGLAGVVQAQHNVVVDLARFPSAMNLRQVLIAQAQLSQGAARLAAAVDPSLGREFQDRAVVYRDLARASRTLGGELGAGTRAALESAKRSCPSCCGSCSGGARRGLAASPWASEPARGCADRRGRRSRLPGEVVFRRHQAAVCRESRP
jgi:hypothetical protein